MSENSETWTDEQKDAIKRWKEKPPEERHPHDLLPDGRKSATGSSSGTNAVTPDECGAMRRVFKQDDDITIKAMAETKFAYSRTTIAEHVFGRRCSHDLDEPAAESPMESIDPDEFIQPAQCADMRRDYHTGDEITEVQARHNTSYGQTYHHLAGRCKCEHPVPDMNAVPENDSNHRSN